MFNAHRKEPAPLFFTDSSVNLGLKMKQTFSQTIDHRGCELSKLLDLREIPQTLVIRMRKA